MFQSRSPNSSCFVAQSRNCFIIATVCTKFNSFWILDSGATDHMTRQSQFFSSYKSLAGNHKVRIADGSFATIAGKGTVKISSFLVLQNVLHIPTLSYNLVSVSKLTLDLNCQIIFLPSHCEFQDLTSRKRFGGANLNDGLYTLYGITFEQQDRETRLGSISVTNKNQILLWHYANDILVFSI